MRVSPLILACVVAYSMAAQTDSGSAFRVHVVNSLTGTPVAGANVVLAHERAARLWGRTDAGGVFAGLTHSPGSHLLTVTRSGYRMTGGGMGKTVDVKSGAETSVTVEMLPLGVIAGRVLDQYGDPVRNANVRTEDKISVPGQDQYYESYSAATTDDHGEYRITDVQPGKHYVAVEYSSIDTARGPGIGSYRWPKTGGLVLYPDATDLEQARQVEVAAGSTTRLNDVHLTIQRAVTISGGIKPSPAPGSMVSLQRTAGLALHSSPTVQAVESGADGRFKIETLPGKYVLTASDGKTGKMSKPLTIEVREKDISGLDLELTSAYEISGRVVVDGRESIDFSKIVVNVNGAQVKVDGSGTFQTHLLGGKGHYRLYGLTSDWYIKHVLVAGKPIMGRQFEIVPGNTDVIFTLSPRGGQVAITLDRAAGGLLPVLVTLLPESGEVQDVESILHAEPDEFGKFIVRAVPPGSYRVFTLDVSNWALMMRPDVLLEKYRKLVSLISVAEGEHKQLVIPVVKIQME